MNRVRIGLVVIGLCLCRSAPIHGQPPAPPQTPKQPVTDTYHGVRVTEDYRWLENTDDPAVQQWIRAQDKIARATFASYPSIAALRARLTQLMADPQPRYFALRFSGGRLFALKEQPPNQQPMLVVMDWADAPESARVLVDPNQLSAKGKTTIDFYEPSLDGKLVAVSLSENGSEDGTLYVFDAASGQKLNDVIARVNYPTAGGSVAWNSDGSGFYYARLPRPGERPKEDLNFFQRAYFHKLGALPESDTLAIGSDFPRIAEVFLDSSDDGKYLLVTVQNGDSGQFEHFLHSPDDRWTQLTQFTDEVNAVAIGVTGDRSLYLLTYRDAPNGRIFRLSLDDPDLNRAKVFVPESDLAMVGMRWQGTRMIASHVPTTGGVYVLYIDGGPSQLKFFPLSGGPPTNVPLPPISAVREIVRVGGDRVLLHIATYTEPAAWYEYQPGDPEPRKTALRRRAPASFDDIEVVRVMATSADGTQVPMTVMHPKGIKLDGRNPALLYGYGGYGISMTPGYDPSRRIWFDQGGVYAIANIRGGGDYGERWHKAAMRAKRPNGYADFFACAKLLIDQGYTSPKLLAIEGGSNGGLLMGVALTQHPELFRAVVSLVGIYDMLRSELSPNGTFNIPEFGTVTDPEEFKVLLGYSPQHNVKDGTAYPAVLLTTGVNDGRVEPYNSYKMAARLQAATSSGRPILLRVTFDSGHGLGEALSEEINEKADVYAFLFEQLGIKYRPGPPARDNPQPIPP